MVNCAGYIPFLIFKWQSYVRIKLKMWTRNVRIDKKYIFPQVMPNTCLWNISQILTLDNSILDFTHISPKY